MYLCAFLCVRVCVCVCRVYEEDINVSCVVSNHINAARASGNIKKYKYILNREGYDIGGLTYYGQRLNCTNNTIS